MSKYFLSAYPKSLTESRHYLAPTYGFFKSSTGSAVGTIGMVAFAIQNFCPHCICFVAFSHWFNTGSLMRISSFTMIAVLVLLYFLAKIYLLFIQNFNPHHIHSTPILQLQLSHAQSSTCSLSIYKNEWAALIGQVVRKILNFRFNILIVKM